MSFDNVNVIQCIFKSLNNLLFGQINNQVCFFSCQKAHPSTISLGLIAPAVALLKSGTTCVGPKPTKHKHQSLRAYFRHGLSCN